MLSVEEAMLADDIETCLGLGGSEGGGGNEVAQIGQNINYKRISKKRGRKVGWGQMDDNHECLM